VPGAAVSTPAFGRIARHLGEPQHRTAYLLMGNTLLAAAAGLVFWLVLTRWLQLPSETVGVGYATVAVGTTIGVLAKGGLDTALVRTVPSASGPSAARLLLLAAGIGAATAVLVAVALLAVGGALSSSGGLAPLSGWAWAAAAAIGLLLVVTWLQDAWFLAEGSVQTNLLRTIAASAVRITVPFALVAWAAPTPVATAWGAALLASALVGLVLVRRRPQRDGREVQATEFLGSAGRNMAGSAAEFLPGLLLAPIVLATDGPAAAAYFGMAWTVASMLFLAAGAIGRSALATMARPGTDPSLALRRGLLQTFAVVGPGAIAGILLAPWILGVFGADYAREGALAFAILCASILVVAPASLYLAVLRIRERTLPLVALPLATIALLLLLTPALDAKLGLPGVALAWTLANAPFGVWAIARLAIETRSTPGASPAMRAEVNDVA
ncbi:MAG: lipopolysaccharide biosynthesis protein, partial [Thermoplasmatota archaeon]